MMILIAATADRQRIKQTIMFIVFDRRIKRVTNELQQNAIKS